MLSIIIPTLNCRSDLSQLLDTLSHCSLLHEIIISDGGSNDSLKEVIGGIRLIVGKANRGEQLAAGASKAMGAWFLFLHCDSKLQPGWEYIVKKFMLDHNNRYRAGYFSLIFDDSSQSARWVEKFVEWRSKTLGLPYGDQGLLINGAYYEYLGGFKSIPLMEDVDIVRRIGRQRLIPLASAVVTSAKRYHRDGWLRRSLKNLLCLTLYFLGVSPDLLIKIYR